MYVWRIWTLYLGTLAPLLEHQASVKKEVRSWAALPLVPHVAFLKAPAPSPALASQEMQMMSEAAKVGSQGWSEVSDRPAVGKAKAADTLLSISLTIVAKTDEFWTRFAFELSRRACI